MAQAPDPPMLKSQTENLGVFPVWLLWTADLHLSLSVEILVMEQGVPASVFLPGGARAPQVKTMSIIVRWSQWSRNPGQIESDYHQLWHSHWERDWHPPGQFTELRVVCPGLDRTGQICWCYCHGLANDKSKFPWGRHFIVLGESSISLTLVQACSTLSWEGVR